MASDRGLYCFPFIQNCRYTLNLFTFKSNYCKELTLRFVNGYVETGKLYEPCYEKMGVIAFAEN